MESINKLFSLQGKLPLSQAVLTVSVLLLPRRFRKPVQSLLSTAAARRICSRLSLIMKRKALRRTAISVM